ncbi:MAG: hypothetical protein C0180_00470 [Aciduliprofundum sp.]|nr:MAG: hypothetical protein C0180_00470 [Aciduliprofundum sp.]
MDEIDKKILRKIQESFPVSPDPYLDLSMELHIDRDIIVKKILNLSEMGYIKRIVPRFGNKFYSNSIGALIGASVEEDSIESLAEILNRYGEITHIYMRDNEYNLWFTFVTVDENKLKRFKDEILTRREIKKYVILMSEMRYKLNVNFGVD